MVTKNEKSERIVIRCCRETKRRWEIFNAKLGFKNYEETLNWLITKAEGEWLPERAY